MLQQSRDLVVVETCLKSYCLATDIFCGSAILAFRGHVFLSSVLNRWRKRFNTQEDDDPAVLNIVFLTSLLRSPGLYTPILFNILVHISDNAHNHVI
jgi:hypothetical protein